MSPVFALLLPLAAAMAPPTIFFDLSPHGRVEVSLTAYETLPRLVENVRLIAANERAPRCSFDGAPVDGCGLEAPRYRWAHGFAGAGRRPAIAKDLLRADARAGAKHAVFGGEYYGAACGEGDVALTTPVAGPGALERFAFVRVGASPAAWKTRLLAGAAVLGVCDAGADAVLARAAASTAGVRIAAAGVVAPDDDDCLVPAPDDLPGDDCLWDAAQEVAWRERRFLKAEKEGFRDPARGNSGTVR